MIQTTMLPYQGVLNPRIQHTYTGMINQQCYTGVIYALRMISFLSLIKVNQSVPQHINQRLDTSASSSQNLDSNHGHRHQALSHGGRKSRQDFFLRHKALHRHPSQWRNVHHRCRDRETTCLEIRPPHPANISGQ